METHRKRSSSSPDPARRRAVRLLTGLPALAVGGVLPAGSARSAPRGTPLPRTGEPLALPDVPLFDGSLFKAEAAAGQVVVLYWWASWCPFCALQSPEIQKLWERNRSRGLSVLGIATDARIDAAKAYMAQRGYTFPSAFNTPALERVLPKPGKGVPITCVRGRDGRVRMAEQGQLFPEDIEQIARFL